MYAWIANLGNVACSITCGIHEYVANVSVYVMVTVPISCVYIYTLGVYFLHLYVREKILQPHAHEWKLPKECNTMHLIKHNAT